jgi:CelD/BcsL family acetyltransferase involved in cellulose biosynthesis
MRVTISRPDELGPAELARWRELQRGNAELANPFLAPEFALVLARHRRDVRVAVLEDGPEIVGFFAYQRGRLGVGRALGYGVSNLQGLVHAADLEWEPAGLLERCGLSVFEFDELVAGQCEQFVPRRATLEAAPVIDLSPGFDSWLRTKLTAGKALKAIPRKQRKLGREIGDVTFEFDSNRRDTLDLLIRWKSQQYRRTGRFDRFAWPWFAAAFTDLTEISTADFSGIRSVLSVDGRPVAIQQMLCANGVLSDWFPAYDGSMASYSPGQICWLEFLRAASERGLNTVDLGKGYARHKEIFKDRDNAVVSGWAERRSAVATFRRIQQAPRRRTLEFVLARPGLRRTAREALNGVGRVHTTLRRG